MSCKSCSENIPLHTLDAILQYLLIVYSIRRVAKQCSNDSTFNICKGDNFSDVQSLIFDKICLKLIGDTNVSTIQIPTCLKTGMGWFRLINLQFIYIIVRTTLCFTDRSN